MKSKNIEIRRITFSKFEFNIHNTGEVEEDGRASINLNLPDRNEGQENQLILIKMEISLMKFWKLQNQKFLIY